MATTKEIILDIEVNNKVAIENIVKLRKQMDELKVEQLALKGAYDLGEKSLEEYDRESAALEAQLRNVKSQIREYSKEIDNNIQKQEAQEGSLRQMRAELKNMVKEYDSLSAADRNSEVGVKMRNEIKDLTDQLKNLEGETGRFQRNVGDYRNAIQEALNGTIPLKTVLKELKGDIQTLSFQYRQYGDEIKNQKAALDQLANTIGTDTDEYKQQAQALADLEQKYKETGDAINNMQIAAGNISDTISDTNASIANFGKDNANIKAVSEGMGVLANSYSVVQAGMAAFGAESEDLIRIWAKIQVMQQGINAVNQIAAALEKESVLRQQLRIVTNKLLGKSMEATAAAKQKDAAASVEAAAGDAALAAGETAATAAAGGLTVALKAVGTAIKSIPVIGWILAAVAALATLTTLVVKHLKTEKEENAVLTQRKQIQKEINDLNAEGEKNAQKNIANLKAQVEYLNSLEKGTKEWSNALQDVADTLGVTKEELGENAEKLEEYAEAWIKLQILQAKADVFTQKIAENESKLVNYETEIYNLLKNTPHKERTAELQKQYGFSKGIAENITKAFHIYQKNNNTENYVAFANAINEARSGVEETNQFAEDELLKIFKESGELTSKYFTKTKKEASKTTKDIKEDTLKNTKQLTEQLEDLVIENMADGLEKQIKQVEVASQRWIDKMKEARDKDLDNKDLYDKLIEEKEKQTQAKVDKIRETGYKAIGEQLKKISESYNKIFNGIKTNPLSSLETSVKQIREETEKAIKDINKQIGELQKQAYDIDLSNIINFSKLVDFFDGEDIQKALTDFFKESFKISEKSAQEAAKNLSKNFKSRIEKEGYFNTEAQITIVGEDEDGKVKRLSTSIDQLFRHILYSLNRQEIDVVKIGEEYEKIYKLEGEALDKADEAQKKRIGAFSQEYIIRKKADQEYYNAAQDNLEKLMKQAERGALTEIPDSFTVYINFEIENLEEEIAKERDKLANARLNGDEEAEKNSLANIEAMNKELERQYTLLKNVNQATELERKELEIANGIGLEFFDNQELMEVELEMEKIRLQIEAVNKVKQEGIALESQIAEKESEVGDLRSELAAKRNIMTDEEIAKEQERIDAKQAEIDQLKQQMATIGYTGQEAMDNMLTDFDLKTQILSKRIKQIMANTANSILTSLQTVTNALQGLFQEIGEDNAQMTNFLEAMAYVQIGVNLAVGISEAIKAGAGKEWPENLVAIATGVAAVVGAMSAAISTYKQYHKDVTSPTFATGGVIGGRTARTREEGRRDDVSIMASRGEYIINADKVKEYGIEFFDAINFGKKMRKLNISGKYADGGVINQTTIQQVSSNTQNYEGLVAALQEMPNPVVSVKEITSTQRRVQAKENISKK